MLGGFGAVILAFAIFLAQGGFADDMNPLLVWGSVAGFIIGLALIAWGLLKTETRLKPPGNLLEDIKSDLATMRMCERETATRKAETPCSRETAKYIVDDYTVLFEAFQAQLPDVVTEGNFDALVEYSRRFGDMLDDNEYGLKSDLEYNETYRSSRMDLAQKRPILRMSRRKRAIVGANIDRVCSLSYGMNSHILFRGILSSVPEARAEASAELRVVLQGIEATLDRALNDVLEDLERDWSKKRRRWGKGGKQ